MQDPCLEARRRPCVQPHVAQGPSPILPRPQPNPWMASCRLWGARNRGRVSRAGLVCRRDLGRPPFSFIDSGVESSELRQIALISPSLVTLVPSFSPRPDLLLQRPIQLTARPLSTRIHFRGCLAAFSYVSSAHAPDPDPFPNGDLDTASPTLPPAHAPSSLI
jgi:hypothetical protein